MAKVSDLLRQGRSEEVWTKYCGFLDLGLDNFMDIQRRLLTEQLQLSGHSELGRSLMEMTLLRMSRSFGNGCA